MRLASFPTLLASATLIVAVKAAVLAGAWLHPTGAHGNQAMMIPEAQAQPEPPAKKPPADPASGPAPEPAKARAQGEDRDAAPLPSLSRERKALEARKQELAELERKIAEAQQTLSRRLDELEALEARIRARLKEEESIKDKKIKRLAAVYESMKPDKAAPVIARMDLGTVVRMFLLMDEKRVGKILSYVPADKAVVISEALTRRLSMLR